MNATAKQLKQGVNIDQFAEIAAVDKWQGLV